MGSYAKGGPCFQGLLRPAKTTSHYSPMTPEQKRANFCRLYPPAVEKLVDRLRIVQQKSVKGNYEWDQDLVHDSWILIARCFAETASHFGVQFEVLVDGEGVDYVQPKRKTK